MLEYFGILAVASWPFWLLFAAFFCLEVYEVEKAQKWDNASLFLVIFLVLTLAFTDWRPWQHFSIVEAVIYISAYISLGVIYMIGRYWLFLMDSYKEFTQYDELKHIWDQGNLNNLRWHLAWEGTTSFREAVRASHNMPPYPWDPGVKSKIYLWTFYWIFSAPWVLLHRPLEAAWEFIYMTVKGFLKDMADNSFERFFRK